MKRLLFVVLLLCVTVSAVFTETVLAAACGEQIDPDSRNYRPEGAE